MASSNAWELWYQDTFDRHSSRRVECAGDDLIEGLAELWDHHLSETVRANGIRGFARFNLWLKSDHQSIAVEGPWEGQLRLRAWIEGAGKRDTDLLRRVARAHHRLIRAGATSAELVTRAQTAESREIFVQSLDHPTKREKSPRSHQDTNTP